VLKATAQDRSGTKTVIVEAALATLKEEGFAGASARTIARRGGFNQALVFYHFGSVTNLLLAALDESSARRMAAYQTALEELSGPGLDELVALALRLYREDLASGHITVVTEMIAGSLADPALKAQIAGRVEQWVDLAEAAVAGALGGSALGGIMPARDIAYGIVAMYLGVEMLTQLHDDEERVAALFATAQSVGAMASTFMGPS
jgi:AcrR family transcriptional regulator